MEWILKTKGIINHYNENIHTGTQPVRILNHMNIYMFTNTHPDFATELETTIDDNKISRTINITYGESKINRTPYIKNDDRAIHLDETFLSYLWCVCHSIYTIYIQEIDFPKSNAKIGHEHYKVDGEILAKAYKLFDYAKSLIVDFTKWDVENLPNPEIYLAENRDYIEQPNGFYTEAIKFILCHEYTHAIKHIDKVNAGGFENSHFIEFEKEADFDAIELMKKGIFPNKINEFYVQIGITIGILSMFFFKAKTTGARHPNTEDRLVTALEQLNLDANAPSWGLALIGLRLWSNQFELNLKIDEKLGDKDAFYDLIKQIKNTNA
ncbi:hypothetical protein IR010_03185 [Flavobacterium sp. MR2016-29]|uniref:phage exclusion protein Lit family protein n=1 Tax=Flavobacterium sp. MR2016-29 TaxID=2783795 RepID=UPI00188AA4BF|nr:phage exclusion protein Lit family protein [Flavobacterium sp. MR2016-29]MBF4491530.1 hypothetical protein [Flavobacterium sp. MR2016-29]